MDIKVPLNRLKFGHEDGIGINARVAGRDDDIASLAANIFSNRTPDNPTGLIENLIVKDVGEGFFAPSNGNRRLKALHMIDGQDSEIEIGCTLHDVDEEKAFEFSLATAITARQLHPVDQYEAFARLEAHGKSNEEIAQQYGMGEKEVRQALALGRLSPNIRQAWRSGDIKAEVARAFTLGLDHANQDRVFDKLKKDGHGHLSEGLVKKELGAFAVDADVAELLDVVGAEAYRAAGGFVTEDLFGKSHIISDENLLKQMTRQLLIAKCDELQAAGWGWADIAGDLPHGSQYWAPSQPKSLSYLGDEKQHLDKIKAELEALENDESDLSYNDQEELQEKLQFEVDSLMSAVRSRSFDAKKMKALGCIVDVQGGRIIVLYGIKKPVEVKTYPTAGDNGDDGEAAAPKSAAKATTAPEEPEISNALRHRLSVTLTKAAATALIQDEQLALSVLLAGFGCYSDCGVKVTISGLGSRDGRDVLGSEKMPQALALASRLKPAERITLLTQIAANALDFQNAAMGATDSANEGPVAICNAIDAKALNAALRGAFDAKDYFSGVNKTLCLKAIEEAMGTDMARQQSKNPKGDIAAFAIENVPTTGWLPLQLRAKGYDGPPVKKASSKLASISDAKKKPAKGKPAAKPTPAKRAAASKKPAKKTSKKRK